MHCSSTLGQHKQQLVACAVVTGHARRTKHRTFLLSAHCCDHTKLSRPMLCLPRACRRTCQRRCSWWR